MRNKILTIAAALLLAIPALAIAHIQKHSWWLENHNTEQCVSSNSVGGIFVTPYKMWIFMRDNDGHDIRVKKFNYPATMGYSILVSGKEPGSHHARSVTFFSSLKGCEGFVHFAVQHGYQPDIQAMK